MGQSTNRGRLFLYEVVLSLHQPGAKRLPGDLGEDRTERQPSDVLGASELRREDAHAENRCESALAENQPGREARTRLGTLRRDPTDWTRPFVVADTSG